jgi:SAM-dependent methyltransferase
MNSVHADEFNHNPYASRYDADVRQEDNPIRAGYSAVQAWLGQMVAEDTAVLDLGCGTGNTILPDLAEAFAEEFFWPVDDMKQALSERGWTTEWRQFSDLSWTVFAWLH